MSVIMTLWAQGDPDKFESTAQQNADTLQEIVDAAKSNGLIAHRFYGSEGQIMVVDEWPDEQSFRNFFESQQDKIQPLMQEGGVTSEPQIRFWRKLETGDDVGWDG
jgi:heme-degrading monooxygenase HmoA